MESVGNCDAPPVDETVTLSESVTTTTLNDTEIEVNAFSASLDEIQNQIETFVKDMKTMSTELKNSKKRYLKIVKTLSKTKKRKTSSTQDESSKKEPSGFISPIEIPANLAGLMKVTHKMMLPRTVVTKHIISFIKENHLESKTNGRNFDLTDPSNSNASMLKKLFNIERGDEVTYFNLQSYLKPHFIPLPKKSKNASNPEEPKEVSSDDTTVVDNAEAVEVSKKLRIGKKKNKKAALQAAAAAEEDVVV